MALGAPWRRLSKVERVVIEAEAARIAAFLTPGVPLDLTILDPVQGLAVIAASCPGPDR